MIGVTVSKFWRPNVSHVIAATDEKGSFTRTLKVLMAILNGSWVLKIDCKLATAFYIANCYSFNLLNIFFFFPFLILSHY